MRTCADRGVLLAFVRKFSHRVSAAGWRTSREFARWPGTRVAFRSFASLRIARFTLMAMSRLARKQGYSAAEAPPPRGALASASQTSSPRVIPAKAGVQVPAFAEREHSTRTVVRAPRSHFPRCDGPHRQYTIFIRHRHREEQTTWRSTPRQARLHLARRERSAAPKLQRRWAG